MISYSFSRSKLWEFRIEQKQFALFLSNDGGSVIISEKQGTIALS